MNLKQKNQWGLKLLRQTIAQQNQNLKLITNFNNVRQLVTVNKQNLCGK